VFANPGPLFTRIAPQRPLGPALVAVSRLFPLHADETQALVVAGEQGADLLVTDDIPRGWRRRNLDIECTAPWVFWWLRYAVAWEAQRGGGAGPSETWPLDAAHPPCTVG
jgi:hypothetical protein